MPRENRHSRLHVSVARIVRPREAISSLIESPDGSSPQPGRCPASLYRQDSTPIQNSNALSEHSLRVRGRAGWAAILWSVALPAASSPRLHLPELLAFRRCISRLPQKAPDTLHPIPRAPP